MATEIAFNDGGAAVLNNGRTPPFDRFWQWLSFRVDIGPRNVLVATGVTNVFVLRTDHCVSLEIRDIPESKVAIAHRLTQWLTRGNTATLNAGDPAGSTYTVRLRPGTMPSLQVQDERKPTYSYRVELKNTAAADILATYGG